MMASEIVVFATYPFARNVKRIINSLISTSIGAADISFWFPPSLTSDEFRGDRGNGSRRSDGAIICFKDMGRIFLGRALFDVSGIRLH